MLLKLPVGNQTENKYERILTTIKLNLNNLTVQLNQKYNTYYIYVLSGFN